MSQPNLQRWFPGPPAAVLGPVFNGQLSVCYPIDATVDFDTVLEVFLDNSKIKTPYDKEVAFAACPISRWNDPECVPAIGSRIPISRAAGNNGLYEPVCILVVYGNDQYIQVYPNPQEIGSDHRDRLLVEEHFNHRGLSRLREVPQFKFNHVNGLTQASATAPGYVGPLGGQPSWLAGFIAAYQNQAQQSPPVNGGQPASGAAGADPQLPGG